MATTAYISAARAQQHAALASLDESLIELLVAAASRIIEKWCRKSLLEAETTEVRNGDGTNRLILKRTPVDPTSMAVVITMGDDVQTTYTFDQDDLFIEAGTGIIQFKYNSTAEILYFPEGFQNVSITYTAGYADDDMPEDIQEACAELAANMYSMQKNDPRVFQERLGEWGTMYVQQGIRSMPDYIKELLAPYRTQVHLA